MDQNTSSATLTLIERFFGAIEQCNIPLLRELYSDDAIIWHNYDPLPARLTRPAGQSVADNLALLQALPKLILGFKYEVWHQELTETGFVRQHIVTGKTSDGGDVSLPVCVVCRVVGGRIDALYEYLDAAHLPASILNYFAEQARISQ